MTTLVIWNKPENLTIGLKGGKIIGQNASHYTVKKVYNDTITDMKYGLKENGGVLRFVKEKDLFLADN